MAPTQHELEQVVLHELDGLYKFGPKGSLASSLEDAFRHHGFPISGSYMEAIWTRLASVHPNDPLRLKFGECLRRFDSAPASGLLASSAPLTVGRRQAVYSILDVPDAVRPELDVLIPKYEESAAPTIIADKHERWYTLERRTPDFYWCSYCDYLRSVGNWPEESLAELELAASLVVDRLSDPARGEAYSVRGLVVGHVQSGKTANFTAVIAKAADAGYRLIVVLAGTLDILREQTQRRIDKELVGRETIRKDLLEDEYDYFGDKDWNDFASYEGLEGKAGFFEWKRITSARADYQELKQKVTELKSAKAFPDRPTNDLGNLLRAGCRLVVMKKNSQILDKLLRDLRRMRSELPEIPVLIIDDESDQASINVAKNPSPSSTGEKERTGINKAIVGVLKAMPRSQYVGYTATPFANVLIDAADRVDLFPRDFVISLKRPRGYMGVSDFFDLAPDLGDLLESEKPPHFQSREHSFVRFLDQPDDRAARHFPSAIDSFFLSGALKLFRIQSGCRVAASRHHTMLVHISTKMAEHKSLADTVLMEFRKATASTKRLEARLRKLWRDEFVPIAEIWGEGAPMPESFDALLPHVRICIEKISVEPVRVVNSDLKHADTLPRFDKDPVWSILVGGSKLARGYTVEGLTVSYYRRRIKTADTLMQVGRWFGFRQGYRDLVRLYVDKPLYEDFKSICRDEEVFRRELDRYVDPKFDPPLRPVDIPPLVPSHKLKPTAANKMQRAKVAHQNFSGQWKEKVALPTKPEKRKHNADSFTRMLANAEKRGSLQTLGWADPAAPREMRSPWRAYVWIVSKAAVVEWVRELVWLEDARETFDREIGYLTGNGDLDPLIDRFVVLLPQRAEAGNGTWHPPQLPSLHTFERGRTGVGDAFKAISESRHRRLAPMIARVEPMPPGATKESRALADERTGVIVAYPIRDLPASDEKQELESKDIALGFGIQFPPSHIRTVLTYTVDKPPSATRSSGRRVT